MESLVKPVVRRGDKEARKAYAKWHYRQNKDVYKRRAKDHLYLMRDVIADWIIAYLANKSCVDCGEADPVVLEFDHRDGELKKFNIGEGRYKGYSLKTIQIEVAKCDVRCANCHRRSSYIRNRWRSKCSREKT